jgi:hypothetical protein
VLQIRRVEPVSSSSSDVRSREASPVLYTAKVVPPSSETATPWLFTVDQMRRVVPSLSVTMSVISPIVWPVALQLVPPSTDRKIPASVPAYTVLGTSGSKARAFT